MKARLMTLRTFFSAMALTSALLAACTRGDDRTPAGSADTMPAPAVTPAPPMVTTMSAPENLSADNAWIRLLPGELPAAGYLVLRNDADTPRKLVSVDSDDFDQVMLHQSMQASGMSHMRHVMGIDIPAHGKATLAPGGYHLMLMQPKRVLEVGQTVTLVLHFADGATQSVAFEVKPANADGG